MSEIYTVTLHQFMIYIYLLFTIHISVPLIVVSRGRIVVILHNIKMSIIKYLERVVLLRVQASHFDLVFGLTLNYF